ncbi:MAG TPA: FlgD immunoglobulin-like domain containing protein, partial [bacterium]|nr:FlgD immunoglobulin-like domain containing protein [bacterium]
MIKNKFIFWILLVLFFRQAVYSNITNLKCSPNPFAQGAAGQTTISYDLSINSDLVIGIYNETGALINRLYLGNQTSGAKSHIWTGVDTNGVEQPAGLYKAKLMQRQQLIEGLRIESNQSMSNPQDLAVDIYGNVYVADYGKHSIKKFSKNGTFLWSKGKIGSGGVVGGDPEFYKPRGITVDKNG